MLLGYQYNNSASGPCTHGSLTLLNADQISSLHNDAASYNTDHLDNNRDKEDENEVEGTGEYRPYATGSNQGFGRDDTRFR